MGRRILHASLLATVVVGGAVLGQEVQRGRPQGRSSRQWGGARSMGAGGVALVRQYDKNGDFQVEEEELRQSLAKAEGQFQKVHAVLLDVFDTNKNKQLDPDETGKLRAFMYALDTMRQYDQNRDWKVDDEEMEQAWGRLADMCQQYNETMSLRYDQDKDGTLSAEEIEVGKKKLKALSERWQRPQPGAGKGQKK